CHQCSEINGFVNPKQEAQQLKLSKMVDKDSQKAHLFTLRTMLIKSINPLASPGTKLHAYLLSLIDQSVT
ncbi:MAG: RNA polymerase sigma factor, partial [Chloroflexota bacterium]